MKSCLRRDGSIRAVAVASLAVCLLLTASCHSQAQGAASGPYAKAGALALELTNDLAQHHAEKLYPHFDAQMKQLPQVQLELIWNHFQDQYGPFGSATIGGTVPFGKNGAITSIACKFARKTVILNWALDTTNLAVTGLHVAGVE